MSFSKAHVFLGRIYFFIALELMVACFFKASKKEQLLPLSPVLKGLPTRSGPPRIISLLINLRSTD